MESTTEPTTFDEKATRKDAMHQTIETWCEELVSLVADAQASEHFQAWLDVQSRFHDYSYRNTLLIHAQCPGATRVAGYRTWQNEFDRQVNKGEEAIWIWAPIIARRCPECQNSPSYHENTDCTYSETSPDEWAKGVVSFRPVSIFDVSQTEGESLPELDTDASGSIEDRFEELCRVSDSLNVSVRLVDATAWEYGNARGVCHTEKPAGETISVEIKNREDTAAMAGTLIHEYAHALLHTESDDTADIPEARAKREVEAEAVAYIVGRYVGLDMSGSAFYLAAWQDEDTDTISARLWRITDASSSIISAIAD